MTGEELKEMQQRSIDRFLQSDDLQKQADFQLSSEIPRFRYNKDVKYRIAVSSMICEESEGEKDLYQTAVNQWLKPNDHSNKNSCIAVVGQSEIGKTQLLKTMLKDLRHEYDFIFYVSLEHLNCSDEINVLQFLTNQASLRWLIYDTDIDFELFKRVIERLDDPKQKVCIILDDFEKSSFSFSDSSYSKSIFEIAEVGYMISKTFNTWFNHAFKIFSLTPWQFVELNLKPNHLIYVKGINVKGQEELNARSDVIEKHEASGCPVCRCCHLNNCQLELQSLCYVPSNCKLLLQLTRSLPSSTVTVYAASIFTLKLMKLFQQNFKQTEKFDFNRILRFAWKKLAKNSLIFKARDLIRFGLSKMEINIFFSCRRESMVHSLDSLYQQFEVLNLVFFFSHVLLQEFLAALWLLSRPSEELKNELTDNRESFLKGRFDVVQEFMVKVSTDPNLTVCQRFPLWNLRPQNCNELAKFLGNEAKCDVVVGILGPVGFTYYEVCVISFKMYFLPKGGQQAKQQHSLDTSSQSLLYH